MTDKEYTDEETAQRRDSVLKIMLNTKPQPHVTAPPSRVQSQKKAGGEKPDPGPETPDRET